MCPDAPGYRSLARPPIVAAVGGRLRDATHTRATRESPDTAVEQLLFRGRNEGAVRRVLGMTHVNKLLPVESGGYLLLEVTVPPGRGAPLHLHEIDAECFYMLQGELTITDGDSERIAQAGDCCYLPARRAHAFANRGAVPARALVIATPGRAAETFFDELDGLADAPGSPDPSLVVAIAGRHALSFGCG